LAGPTHHSLQSKSHSAPPVSLEGQLLWREFFYAQAFATPCFDRMAGNPACKQIAWSFDPALIAAWAEGRTGYPWIDACMAQLRREGWLHHLARHAVACFLTRGDLYQSWEHGARIFDRELVDSDWALNNGARWWPCALVAVRALHSRASADARRAPTSAFRWLCRQLDVAIRFRLLLSVLQGVQASLPFTAQGQQRAGGAAP
jgi:deoxyribodipyrimidine photolyase